MNEIIGKKMTIKKKVVVALGIFFMVVTKKLKLYKI